MKNSCAQQTNYFIVFGLESLGDVKFYLKGCNLPGLTLDPASINNKIRNQYIAGDKIEYNPLTISILVDEEFEIYLSIIDEINKLKNNVTGEVKQIPFTSVLFITTNKGNPIIKMEFEDCFINTLSDINFSTGDTSNTTLSFDMTLKYTNIKYTKL